MIELNELRILQENIFGRKLICYPNLTLKRGLVYCLSGRNASGKSTLVNYLFGTSNAKCISGNVRLGGQDIEVGVGRHLGDLGYRLLPQRRPLSGNVSLRSAFRLLSAHRSCVSECLASMDNLLCKERPRVKRWSRIKLLQLSGGEFKAAIIAAYAANRSLAGMILDEPLAGMAPEAQVKVLAFLCCTAKARHIPIMLTSVLREPRPSLDEAIADGRISKLPTLADQADLDNIPVMEN